MTGTQTPSQEEHNDGIVLDQTSQFYQDYPDEPGSMFDGFGGGDSPLPGTTAPPDYSTNNDALLAASTESLEPNIADGYMHSRIDIPWTPVIRRFEMTGEFQAIDQTSTQPWAEGCAPMALRSNYISSGMYQSSGSWGVMNTPSSGEISYQNSSAQRRGGCNSSPSHPSEGWPTASSSSGDVPARGDPLQQAENPGTLQAVFLTPRPLASRLSSAPFYSHPNNAIETARTAPASSATQERPLYTPPTLLPKGKRKGPYTEETRDHVKRVRDARCCIRCRMQKLRCDDEADCPNCAQSSAKLVWPPCSRAGYEDVIPFRAGNSRAGKSRYELIRRADWPSMSKGRNSGFEWAPGSSVQTVWICYPFRVATDSSETAMPIGVRRFRPSADQVLEEPWECPDGQVVPLRSEPYACVINKDNQSDLAKYVERWKDVLLAEAIDQLDDRLIREHYQEAVRFSREWERAKANGEKDQPCAVTFALNIQAAAYFSRTRMVEKDSGGVKLLVNDENRMKLNGMPPIPAHLDVQIDRMAIQYMLQQMVHIDTRLKKAIFVKEYYYNWYEVYLTSFLLLCSLETVHRRQTEIVKRFESSETPGKHASVLEKSNDMLRDWQRSAVFILHHWRAILRGQLKFAKPWNDEDRNRMRKNFRLDDEAVKAMDRLNNMIHERKDEFREAAKLELDNKEARPMAWLAHLWVEDYTCVPTVSPKAA